MNTGGYVQIRPLGRRIYKSSSSATSVYAYDSDNLVEETTSAGAGVARYSQGLNIDEPLAMLRSSAASYYHADGLGTITSLSNTAGSIANTYTFDSFGNLTGSSGSLTNPFQYTACEFDLETSVYHYRARYYDPTTGRFISEDPIGFLAGTNFFAYVENSPVDFRDELGLFTAICKPSPDKQSCLDKIFGEPTGGVKIQMKINPKKGYSATTRKNLIIITIPCLNFLNDSNQLLEEYYHVLRQWNTGRMTIAGYALEEMLHGYENNKYEIEAKKFANDHQTDYENCLKCKK